MFVPSPSCPDSLAPQHRSTPSALLAQVWKPPPATAVTASVPATLTGVALSIAEAALVIAPLAAAIAIARRAPRQVAREVWRVARIGLLAGFAATLIYDITRTVLSVFDPSPYNPFEAIRRFGAGILPAGTGLAAVMAAGLFIHFLNGSSFGVIYAIFAGRHVRTRRR